MTRLADQQHEEYLTPDDVSVRLAQLSRADRKRLEQISGYLSWSVHDANDLRQEAYLRALDGSRRCRTDQDFTHFLAATMKSIRHSERKGAVRLRPHKEALERGPEAACSPAPPDPLTLLLLADEELHVAMGKLRLFADDPVALTVIEGIMEGFQGGDLCELAEITPMELASKRRLIKRRLDAAKRSKG